MSRICTIFPSSAFDTLGDDILSQEISHLQHEFNFTAMGLIITVQDRHFQLGKTDRTPSGEIAGWWYNEIDGKGRILIIND